MHGKIVEPGQEAQVRVELSPQRLDANDEPELKASGHEDNPAQRFYDSRNAVDRPQSTRSQ